MTETVVHVTTIEEWKSVLDVWFKQGYKWSFGGIEYFEFAFNGGARYLFLWDKKTDNKIYQGHESDGLEFIEYAEFMAQQKEDNKMAKVYEVSQSVFDKLQRIKAHEGISLIGEITLSAQFIKSLEVGNKAILRYLADDPAIEFKVKEQLYRLWRVDNAYNKVYMKFNLGTPTYTNFEDDAFTAPLEEINKWKTSAWSLEKVDE